MKTKNYVVYSLNDSSARLDVRIKFTDGSTYKVSFCSTKYLDGALTEGYAAIPGLLILDKVTMSRVKEVIGDIVESGYFNHLVPEGE